MGAPEAEPAGAAGAAGEEVGSSPPSLDAEAEAAAPMLAMADPAGAAGWVRAWG